MTPNALANIFIFELSTEQVAFIPFYKACQKFLCQEVIDFFLVAFHYKYQPACIRLEWEKKIYDRWIYKRSKFQINLAEKLTNNITARLGKGDNDLYQEAFEHTAESLATNYWFDFTKSDTFKNLDKIGATAKLGGVVKVPFSLKKAMKKEKMPAYVVSSALWFFTWKYELISVPKCKLEDPGIVYGWLSAIGGENEFITALLMLLRSDPDPIFSQSVIGIFFDRPMTISLLFNEMLSDTFEMTKEQYHELNVAAGLPYKDQNRASAEGFKKMDEKKLTSKSLQISSEDSANRIDPFQLSSTTIHSLQYLIRYFLLKCFEDCVLVGLKKKIVELYEMNFEGGIDMTHSGTYSNIISGFISQFFTLSEQETDLNKVMYVKVQLLLQLLFNGCYAKHGDPEGSLHATSACLLEFLCYCIETPAFIDIKVANGVKLRPHIRLVLSMLRNYAYKQCINPIKSEQAISEVVVGLPGKVVHTTLLKYADWVAAMIGLDRKPSFERINFLIDEHDAQLGIQDELDCVLNHILTKGELITKVAPGDVNKYVQTNSALLKSAASKGAAKTLEF